MERCITRREDLKGTEEEEEEEDYEGGSNDCELDLLFNVHSDISSVLHQIDELVLLASKHKTMTKQGSKEVESFKSVLSDMLSSLKPWVPRLQEAVSGSQLLPVDQEKQSLLSTSSVVSSKEEELFDVESPEPTQFESLVSPSPLVSWRADYNADKGRQLFLLTPLPLGKSEFLKRQNASNLTSKKIFLNAAAAAKESLEVSKETSNDVLGPELMKTVGLGNSFGHVIDSSENLADLSTPIFSRKLQSELLMTPCLKMSPPKSCTLLQPVFESSQPENQGDCNASQSSESSSVDKHDDFHAKYPELLGIQHAPITRKTDIESSPVWWFSPPKTCVLMEPVDEKKPIHETGGSKITSSFDFSNIKPEAKEVSMPMVVESTPFMKGAESSVMAKNKRAGESTLKRELWTRFEEASVHENRFSSKSSNMRGNSKKGFLEMLEEVSCDEESEELKR